MKRSVKILSFVLSVCMIISVLGICASAEETAQPVHALILSSKLSNGEDYLSANVSAMESAFSEGNNRILTEYENTAMTKSALQSAISDFAKNSTGSIKFVYITATSDRDDETGEVKINLYNGGMYYSELRTMLDEIPGEIVLMIDADHSGDAIANNPTASVGTLDSATEDNFSLSPEQQIINAFAKYDEENGSSSTCSDVNNFKNKLKYVVFCSCPSTKDTARFNIGRATDAWGTGISLENGKYFADATGDGVLTAKELNDYAVDWVKREVGENADNLPCYYADPFFQPITDFNRDIGDVNGDGSINMKDVLLLRKYIAGQQDADLTQEDLWASDLNQDGAVNMKDVLLLRKYIAGQVITEE